MPTGSQQTILVCAPSAEQVLPCPSGQAPAVLSAYVLAPDSGAWLDAVSAPIDGDVLASAWILAAGAVLVPWALAYCLRMVISVTRF